MTGSPDIEFHYWELAIFPFTIILSILIGWILVKNLNQYSKGIFWISYVIKFVFFLIGSYIIATSEFADAKEYYHSSLIINETFYQDPMEGIKLIFNGPTKLNEEEREIIRGTWLARNTSSGFLSRVAGFMGLFGPPSFLILSFIFSFLAFIGTWIMVVRIGQLFPLAYNTIILTSLIPSLLFWTTVISKDALMVFFFGLFINLLLQKNNRSKHYKILGLVVFGYFLFQIKSYVLVIILISWFISFLFSEDFNLKGFGLKMISRVLVVVIFLLISSTALQFLQKTGSNLGKVNPETVEEATEYLFKDIRRGESIYKIRGINSTIFRLTPTTVLGALEVSYFRPYFNEVSRRIYIPAFFESTITLLLFLFTLSQIPNFNLKVLSDYQKQVLLFIVAFAILFGVVAGLFSFTYGSLVRYKIPGLIFFVIFMTVLLSYRKNLSKIH